MTDWLAELRPARNSSPLTEAAASPDPFSQFRAWLEDAYAAGVAQPNAMALSTVDADGAPDARIVLLKGFDAEGFVFYTHRTSHKGQQLERRKQAALTFWWDPLERQVRVRGRVEWTSDEDSDAYFSSRPRGSQLSAMVSPQSRVVTRNTLEQSLAELEASTAGQPLSRPRTWGGYRVVPTEFEFWQGRANRLHDRIHYHRDDHGWARTRLAP